MIRFTSAEEAIAWLKAPARDQSIPGLSRIRALLTRLNNPQRRCRFIHIAGTNGKGSTAMLIHQTLIAAGYRTGLYISPEVSRFHERIRVNDTLIPDDELIDLVSRLREANAALDEPATQFELITALAFLHFERSACDIVVLETGLGGRFDATNIIDSPELAVLTSISLEHTAILGDTLEAIAAEKAGILKPGCSVVYLAQNSRVDAVFRSRAEALGCRWHACRIDRLSVSALRTDGQQFDYTDAFGRRHRDLVLGMLGAYQLSNAALAIDAVGALCRLGWRIPDSALRQGLRTAHNPARFERLCEHPAIFADAAHNPDGARVLADTLRVCFPEKKIHAVFSCFADKAYGEMIAILSPMIADWTIFEAPSPRALALSELRAALQSRGITDITESANVISALECAQKKASDDAVILAWGSLSFMGELRRRFYAD